jgi:archaellum component FlaC
MSDVSSALMYELLKRMQSDMMQMRDGMREINGQMNAIRDHIAAQSKDISNIYNKLVGQELRLERIERRLDIIAEPAE